MMSPVKKLFIAFFALFLGVSSVFAQEHVVKGKLLDSQTSSPISYATVALYSKQDSSLISGTITDNQGQFKIGNIKNARYFLKISFIGYAEKVIEEVDFTKGQKIFNAGKLILQKAAKALKEVNVKEERLKGKEEIDRTVYNMNDDIVAVSGSGLDVLKHLPGVAVDVFDNVSLEGRGDIEFYVNDILRDKDFVAQIAPEKIDKVEIITSPSAKYDAEISGVINILLKREARGGLNGSVVLEIPPPNGCLSNPRLNLDYGTENFRFYVTDRMHIERYNLSHEEEMLQYSAEHTLKSLSQGQGLRKWTVNTLNAGFDWFVNDQNTLNFNVSQRNRSSGSENYDTEAFLYTDDEITGLRQSRENSSASSFGTYYSVYFQNKSADSKRKISFETGFYNGGIDDYTKFDDQYLEPQTEQLLQSTFRSEKLKTLNQNIPLKFDFEQSFDKLKLEAGYKGLIEWYENQAVYTEEISEKFDYHEQRHAGYVNLTWKIKQLNVQTGLRSEYSKINIDNSTVVDHLNVLPQISLMRKFDKSQSLRLAFRRRLYRPGIRDLNPFERWSDSLHVSVGNPDLKPTLSNKLELTYSKIIKSNMISPKIFARYVTDDIQYISYINQTNSIETRPENMGEMWEYGVGLTAALQPTKWLKFNGNFEVYHRKILSQSQLSAADKVQEKVTCRVNGTAIINPYKDWNIIFQAHYNSPTIGYQVTTSRDLMFMTGIQKEIFKNAKLMLIYIPFFISQDFTYNQIVRDTPTLYNDWEGTANFDFFAVLQFSWRFSYGKQVKKLKRSMENTDKGENSLM